MKINIKEHGANSIFVYGTLMKGQANYDYFMKEATFIGNGCISGYEMYDLGSFPGIIPGDGSVNGEVYDVSDRELEAINRLEGEGSLYIKTEVEVELETGEKIPASAYVYNHSVSGCRRHYGKYGDEEYVWYVSYGSNLLEDRLRLYIQGGKCNYNGKYYSPCSDTTMPMESRPIIIPYDMYYANFGRGSWKNSAVSFLDTSKPGKAYGRAYKIKRSQLDGIHEKEGDIWYPDIIKLDNICGYEAYTFSNNITKKKEPFDRISAEYGIILYRGMKETYSEMRDDEIFEYLKNCSGNNKGVRS
jgi:gamma-glutamylcyclotransferase (GGCT)/AIG2-like uncharacterized protein YtfP